MCMISRVESKMYNKVVNLTKKNQTHVYGELVVTSGEREAGRGSTEVGY